MVTFPNAKINLGLNIVSRRADGYHNLETVFYPIPLCDALEVTLSEHTTLNISGIALDGNAKQNLVMKAYRLLAADFALPQVEINLLKKIPCGAGLGGGSADAAFMINLLNDKFALNLSAEKRKNYAAKLGADCAFFIQNTPAFATGIGDKLENINLSLTSKYIYLVEPNIHISTAEAYANVVPRKREKSLRELIAQPIESWRTTVVNDFEQSVFARHPEIGELKAKFYQHGALYASMSGSGSSVFGIFEQKPTQFDVPKEWFSFVGILE